MSDKAEAPSAIRTAKGEGIESKSKSKAHRKYSFYSRPHRKAFQKTHRTQYPWSQKRSN